MVRGYYLVFVRSGTADHRGRTATSRYDLHLGPGAALCGEADLVEITEEYRVVRAGGASSGLVGMRGIVVLLLQVVPVDLPGEGDPGEVTQELVDRSGNKRKLVSGLETVSVSLPAGDYKISS